MDVNSGDFGDLEQAAQEKTDFFNLLVRTEYAEMVLRQSWKRGKKCK